MIQLGVKVTGLDQLLSQLDKKLGKRKMDRIVDQALISGARVIYHHLQKNFSTFEDTSASMHEMTIGKPRTLNGKRTISIYWQGTNDRWKIIHMNEYGTVKNPNPRGSGAIDSALKQGQKQYLEAITTKIQRAIR